MGKSLSFFALLAVVLGGLSAAACGADAAASGEEGGEVEASEVLKLDLDRCLEVATKRNPDYLARINTILRSTRNLALTRHGYSFLPSGVASTTYSDGEDVDASSSTLVSLDITKKTLLGSNISMGVSSTHFHIYEPESSDEFSSSLTASLMQPLLRDAGRLVAREQLTQAERSLTYTGRSLQLYQQNFVVSIASQYWGLLQQKASIAHREAAHENAKWTLDRAQRLLKVDMASPADVFAAEVDELQRRDALEDTKQSYELSLDNFKLFLGLDIATPIELVKEELSYVPLEIDPDSCIQTALARRLDLMTARDRLEDTERAIKLGKNNLKSDLDLSLGVTVPAGPADTFTDQSIGSPLYSVGLTWQFPLDRFPEKISLANLELSYEEQTRFYNLDRQHVVLEVRRAIRDLRRAEVSIKIQELARRQAEKALKLANMEYSEGKRTIYELNNARENLVIAQEAYDSALVRYMIAKLELRRAIGTFMVDEAGSWEDE